MGKPTSISYAVRIKIDPNYEQLTSNIKDDFVSIIIRSKSNFETIIIDLYKKVWSYYNSALTQKYSLMNTQVVTYSQNSSS